MKKKINSKKGFTLHFLRGKNKACNFKYYRKGAGFTLIEVIIAISIIVVGIISCISLISSSVSGATTGKSKIIAAGLAQEGVEIVRNIRDNNWANYKRTIDTWRDGLSEGDWLVQYNNQSLIPYSNMQLKKNLNGLYQYVIGANTGFYRKINISYIGNNQIKVLSEVTWQEKGKNQSIQIENRLYNWLQE